MIITTEQAIAHLAACTDAQASETARACVHLAAELVRAREEIARLRALVHRTSDLRAEGFCAVLADDPDNVMGTGCAREAREPPGRE